MEYLVDMEHTPTIFPAMTWELMEKGVDVTVVGRREADKELTAQVSTKYFTNNSTLPDCMYYDTGSRTWHSISMDAGDQLVLYRKSRPVLLLDKDKSKLRGEGFISIIRSILTQFSSATLQWGEISQNIKSTANAKSER